MIENIAFNIFHINLGKDILSSKQIFIPVSTRGSFVKADTFAAH